MERKKLVSGNGPILAGGELGAQSYPNKFVVKCADSNNGFAVLVFSVKPDAEPNQLSIDMVDLTVSNNLKKLAERLMPQQLIGSIIEESSFAQLIEQGKQQARDRYNRLDAAAKKQSAVVYYRFSTKFSACPAP
jgi:hypothetical protein